MSGHTIALVCTFGWIGLNAGGAHLAAILRDRKTKGDPNR